MILKYADRCYLVLILAVLVLLPIGISAYDTHVWKQKITGDVQTFYLTGHTTKGWVQGPIKAIDVLADSFLSNDPPPPVLKVQKGDKVVLKLASSDVIHGFSLKDFGLFINNGIHPGKPLTVSFTADKVGRFTFACNSICGSQHENMFGTIIVYG